jgi:hypothetical protein
MDYEIDGHGVSGTARGIRESCGSFPEVWRQDLAGNNARWKSRGIGGNQEQ